ncbi:MAG TPA: hypothetical protein VLV86_08660 [Vicinamibacterales bacterium]|nr:hypothetical protein [Vicinamibacterales bacterium]
MKVYWHRELPPLELVAVGEHSLEADSARVGGTLARREVWDRCASDLAEHVEFRLSQEAARLGGGCAHVLDEHVDVKHDPVRDEAWLHGRYTYMLYR